MRATFGLASVLTRSHTRLPRHASHLAATLVFNFAIVNTNIFLLPYNCSNTPCQHTLLKSGNTADDIERRAARESAPYSQHGEFPNGHQYYNREEPFPGGRLAYTVASKKNNAWIVIENDGSYCRPGTIKLAPRRE